MSVEDLIDEMLEFGISMEVADRMAPVLLPFLNNEPGVEQALIEQYPALAEQMGCYLRH